MNAPNASGRPANRDRARIDEFLTDCGIAERGIDRAVELGDERRRRLAGASSPYQFDASVSG